MVVFLEEHFDISNGLHIFLNLNAIEISYISYFFRIKHDYDFDNNWKKFNYSLLSSRKILNRISLYDIRLFNTMFNNSKNLLIIVAFLL